jgi:hypothetical protein
MRIVSVEVVGTGPNEVDVHAIVRIIRDNPFPDVVTLEMRNRRAFRITTRSARAAGLI